MNHPSDNPDTCCPACHGNGEVDFDERPRIVAALAAAAELERFNRAMTWLNDEGWASPKAKEIRDRWRHKHALTTSEAIEYAIELGWDPKGTK
jgi:hypothetical protein